MMIFEIDKVCFLGDSLFGVTSKQGRLLFCSNIGDKEG
jgi:hypothetical protein